MATILACLDGSAYAPSVCDHATWLSSAPRATIDLLHVTDRREAPQRGARLLEDAATRIADHGAQVRRRRLEDGRFDDVAAREQTAGGAIVVGKRGLGHHAHPQGLGSNASVLLNQSSEPLLLVSKLYLPIHRGLVLIDSDPTHRRTVDYVAAHPILSGLDLDIILMRPIGMDPEPKLSWARDKLGERTADVFPMQHGTPDEAAARYMSDHRVDILIMSRQMLFDQARGLGLDLQRRALWGWRTPLLIC